MNWRIEREEWKKMSNEEGNGFNNEDEDWERERSGKRGLFWSLYGQRHAPPFQCSRCGRARSHRQGHVKMQLLRLRSCSASEHHHYCHHHHRRCSASFRSHRVARRGFCIFHSWGHLLVVFPCVLSGALPATNVLSTPHDLKSERT